MTVPPPPTAYAGLVAELRHTAREFAARDPAPDCPAEAEARATALETALREAEEALSLAADVVADMFRTGAAHTDLGPDAPPAFGYYIGVGVQPTIVRARDAARAHLTHGLGPWVR